MPEGPGPAGIMHLIDTLDAGGAEGVAVGIANQLVNSSYRPHLCTTRREGPLASRLHSEVGRLDLQRMHRFDLGSLGRLQRYIKEHRIRVIHAHSTSLLTGVLASLLAPYPKVIWHVHSGRFIENRRPLPYRLLIRRVAHVIAVNEPLASWSRSRLGVPAARVQYVPNFVRLDQRSETPVPLPGEAGHRIVCVANLRKDKDHITLVRALARVVGQEPRTHLLLAGSLEHAGQVRRIQEEIDLHSLASHVTLLGVRGDIGQVLRSCDIGVISSISEGLPLALLEYGALSLPSISTRVGQCEEVLDHGMAGVLVTPGSPAELADALLMLLRSPIKRSDLGNRLRKRIQECYSPEAVMRMIEQIYDSVLDERSKAGQATALISGQAT